MSRTIDVDLLCSSCTFQSSERNWEARREGTEKPRKRGKEEEFGGRDRDADRALAAPKPNQVGDGENPDCSPPAHRIPRMLRRPAASGRATEGSRVVVNQLTGENRDATRDA